MFVGSTNDMPKTNIKSDFSDLVEEQIDAIENGDKDTLSSGDIFETGEEEETSLNKLIQFVLDQRASKKSSSTKIAFEVFFFSFVCTFSLLLFLIVT